VRPGVDEPTTVLGPGPGPGAGPGPGPGPGAGPGPSSPPTTVLPGAAPWGPPPGPPPGPAGAGGWSGPPGYSQPYATAGPPTTARPARNVPAAALAILGGLLGVVGSLLTWISSDVGDVSGFDASNDAYTVLIVGVLGIALGVLWLLATLDPLARVGGFVALALGIVLAGVAVYDILDVGDLDLAGAAVGIGLWLALAGGVLLIVAGALGIVRRGHR
jgi:hypothetical protein